jgi:hypothetical protein
MKRTIAFVAVIAFCAVGPAFADYSVSDKGEWPKSWPRELEPLRKHARTYEGPLAPDLHYAIPFTKREELESAWPHLLKVKSKGTALRLVRAPNFFLGEHAKAGVVVHCPPLGQEGTTVQFSRFDDCAGSYTLFPKPTFKWSFTPSQPGSDKKSGRTMPENRWYAHEEAGLFTACHLACRPRVRSGARASACYNWDSRARRRPQPRRAAGPGGRRG